MFGATLSTLTTSAKTIIGAINELATSLAAKYTKPGTGIPKTDLASAVQTSLTAADNAQPALKSSNGTDPLAGETAVYKLTETL